jgi:hypothetical protein
MRKNYFFAAAFGLVVLCACANQIALGQQQAAPADGVPSHLVVTAEAHHGSDVPLITRADVMVFEGRDRDTVTDWVPAQGDHAALELFILIDDGLSGTVGTQLEDMRRFINAQPDSTKIGVAYMQDGTARVQQNLTNDRAQAAKTLRLPLGIPGVNASPYFSLSDLVKRWPETTARREVLMVTDGIDRYYGSGDLSDPYLDAAIDDALRAGIMVSAIYTPGAGHFGHSYWQTSWGQNYLSHLSEETGGEAYSIGMTGSPVSFSPFLEDMEKRLMHQYLLTFLAKPPKKAGWQRVRVKTEVSKVDLVSAGRVWVAPAQ